MLELVQAILLGVIQGLTEFLPVSSSGHLLLTQYFLGLDENSFGLAFDAAIHSGTVLAVVSFFRRDLTGMLSSFLRSLPKPAPAEPEVRLAYLIMAATVPAALVGFFLEGFLATAVRSPWVVVFNLAFVGALFLVAEALGPKNKGAATLAFPGAVGIGLAQAAALVPGVSRSGATITLGLFLGLKREEAARFSFLMSVPIIAGAAGLSLVQVVGDGLSAQEARLFGAGLLSSALIGYFAIRFLLSFLTNHSLKVFAYYRFTLAAIVAVVLLAYSL